MTHCQLGSTLMALGETAEGLKEGQWRFKAFGSLTRFHRRFNVPDWNGKNAERVVVFSEQGVGDALHRVRYLKDLKAIGCKVILEVQNELVDLLKGQKYVDEVYGRKNIDFETKIVPDGTYDSVISINDLSCWFEPEMSNPPVDGYLDIKPDGSLKAYRRPRVGLVWAGNGMAGHDRLRSSFLRDLSAIFDVPGITLLNFQKGDMNRCWVKDSWCILEPDAEFDVVNLAEGAEDLLAKMPNVVENCKSFYDTALLLRDLDLLITVDTSMAHLAGAMGIPTWLLLSKYCSWYWIKNWYTSIKYYRPEGASDACFADQWKKMASRVAADLILWKKDLDY
jgi:hypothetical protein